MEGLLWLVLELIPVAILVVAMYVLFAIIDSHLLRIAIFTAVYFFTKKHFIV